ncbi:MAG: S8 family serine peptidase [Chloroflexi bacterium]|nr:S8 family serine peptidase [Chloroflexota bacterium]
MDTYEEFGATEALSFAADRGVRVHQDRLRVMVEAFEGREQDAESQIKESLGLIEQRWRQWFQVSITVANLERLADDDSIRFIDQAREAQPQVVSEGVGVIGANTWHSAGVNGAGVKLAIIDLGFASYTTKLGTELPASVTAVSMRVDGLLDATDHGTAVAEIAYDTAPGAQLFLIAVDTQLDVFAAVEYANAQGVKVINFSAGYFDGNGDGSGLINAIVNLATSYGMVWVNSSGNYGEEHWEGVWSDPDSDFFHNFSGTDETNDISLSVGESLLFVLTWDDPWNASCNNWDLLIYDSSLALVASSTDIQDCNTAPPLETIHFLAPYTDNFLVVIYQFWTFSTNTFDLFAVDHSGLQYKTSSGSLIPPADNSNALTVGAVPWNSPSSIESFSSQGPTTDGRTKPDLVAPDFVSTQTYGSNAFPGTSASAPHAAGAAALVLQLNPCYTRAQVHSFLEGAAVPLGSPGKDNVFGSGRLNMGTLPSTSCAAADADSDGVPDSTDNCPNWYNPSQGLPPWTVPIDDPDCDSFTTAIENFVGTDPTDACANTVTANDEADDRWPADTTTTSTLTSST